MIREHEEERFNENANVNYYKTNQVPLVRVGVYGQKLFLDNGIHYTIRGEVIARSAKSYDDDVLASKCICSNPLSTGMASCPKAFSSHIDFCFVGIFNQL